MSKRIYVDNMLLTEKQTLLLAEAVSGEEKGMKTLDELEKYMDDYSYEEENIVPGQPRIKFINQKYYGPHFSISKD